MKHWSGKWPGQVKVGVHLRSSILWYIAQSCASQHGPQRSGRLFSWYVEGIASYFGFCFLVKIRSALSSGRALLPQFRSVTFSRHLWKQSAVLWLPLPSLILLKKNRTQRRNAVEQTFKSDSKVSSIPWSHAVFATDVLEAPLCLLLWIILCLVLGELLFVAWCWRDSLKIFHLEKKEQWMSNPWN